jgi:YYY domain-containing protein
MADAGLRGGLGRAASLSPAWRSRIRSATAQNIATALALGVILVFGLQLRLTHVNWDDGQHLHPDERYLSIVSSQIQPVDSVGEYFDSENSKLNPYNYQDSFVYGTFPIFLNKLVAEWLDRDADGSTHWTADLFRDVARPFGVNMEHDNGALTFDAGYSSNQVGRVLSAIADVLTIALVFELGRFLFGRGAGLLAAGLLSVTVLHIQYSHFFGSETWLALFVTVTIYFSMRILKGGGGWAFAFAGVAYGLALATKLSALPVLGVPALAVLIRMWPYLSAAFEQTGERAAETGRTAAEVGAWVQAGVAKLVGWSLVLALSAFFVFRIAQPYAFEGPGFFDVIDVNLDLPGDLLSTAVIDPTHYLNLSPKFVQDITNLRNQQSGSDFPPNVQWIGRAFVLFPLSNIVLWGMGVPLAAAAFGAFAYAAWRSVWRRDVACLLLVLWIAGYFLFVARGFNPTMRYFIPIYPALVVLAGMGLMRLWWYATSSDLLSALPRRLQSLRPAAKPLLQGAVAIAVAGTAVWALAFTGVYRQDISRVQASHWIADNIPEGSILSVEEWDDGVPLRLPGVDPGLYGYVTLKPYVPDSRAKVEELVAGLDEVDYVIETSNRLYGSIPRNPARYPSTVLYYQYLFDGRLGFEKVADFTNYPNLFGIEVPDQSAEEAFTVYDHPKVTIWHKTDAYSHDRALALLNPDMAEGAVNLPPAEAARNALLLRPADLETQQEGGTWTDVFSDSGIAASNPTLVWLLALELAALAATPLALVLFRRLPDRGYLLSKPLGVLLLAYPVWLLVSLKLVYFTQSTLIVTLAVLLVIAAVVAYRWREELWAFVREHWRLVVFCEVLFLLAFLFFRELRMANPDLWHPYRGGEKPMDIAYLTAVVRSTTLPPYDPWFSGGYINYYYLGQFLTATLVKLTTIRPEVAFNLAVPTFFALTVAASFSVAYNLAAAARGLIKRSSGFRPIPSWSPYAAGLLGVFLVALAGNLDGVGQLTERLSEVSSWHLNSSLPVVDSVANSIGGAWQVLAHGASLRDFDYWRSSRMLPPTISITEFPYFSFLFADLHAHMMAIAFQILAIGIMVTLVLGVRGERGSWREWVIVALLGLVVGSLRWINSWDYPPFLLLALAALAIGERNAEGGFEAMLKRVVLKALLLGGVSYLAYQPFLANYQSPVSGVIESPETTPMHQYLAHFGVFAALIGGWLLFQLWRAARSSRLMRFASGGWRAPVRSREEASQLLFAAAMLFFLCALAFFLIERGNGFVALLLPALALVLYLALREFGRRRADSGIRLFVLALAGLGLGLSMGVDLVTLQGDIVRMNTVFKFYLHTWVVYALAASFVAWHLAFVSWRPSLAPAAKRASKFAASGAVAGVALLLLGAVLYPIFATPVRLNDRFADTPATLDGMAFMQVATYNDEHGPIDLSYDYEGIQWMRQNVEGSPVIVEGRTPLYRWGGRFTEYTGLPAVLGWDWHQVQQRGDFGYMVGERAALVDSFYADPDVAKAQSFLRRFDVSYVVVGQVESLYYPGPGLMKFRDGLDGVLQPVFENEELTIYRVDKLALNPALAELP